MMVVTPPADLLRARSATVGVFVAVAVPVVVGVLVDVTSGVLVRVGVFDATGVEVKTGVLVGQVKKPGIETHPTTVGVGVALCASATLAFSLAVWTTRAPISNRAGITRNRTSKRKRIQPPLN